MQGVIKVIKADKGFGFIKAEDGQEYFFHVTGLVDGVYFDDLKEGDNVAFDVEDSDRGPKAVNVALAQ